MIGQTISHYRVLELIGKGGMGVVYKAEDLKLSRLVALKFLGVDQPDRLALERFQREARTASALNHPNICTIYEIDEHEGTQFIAMELLQGKPLDQQIAGNPLEVGLLLDLSIQISDALDTAHASGILHRDLKPANIFVTTRGQAKILDFGLAKLAQSSQTEGTSCDVTRDSGLVTTKGITVGTIAYMSPEQARGEDLDIRSDLFSTGVVLYEMATGRQTFSGHTSAIVFDAILNREPKAPIELNAALPPDLQRIIGKALEKDRQLRYQSASDLRADLRRLKRDHDSGRTLSRSGITAAPAPSGPTWSSASGAAVPVTTSPEPAQAATPGKIGRWSFVIAAAVLICIGASLFFLRTAAQHTPPTPAAPEAPAASTATVAAQPPQPAVPAPPPQPAVSSPTTQPAVPAPPPRNTANPPASAPAAAIPAPAAKTEDADPAAKPLQIARAKFDAKLYDQALADLKPVVGGQISSPTVPQAYLLAANIYSAQGHVDDALATYVELRNLYRSSPAAVEGTFQMANLLLRSNRNDREPSARNLLGEIPTLYPKSEWAPRALAAKATLEERAKLRAMDSELNAMVPASLISYRTLAAQYPNADGAELALWKLSNGYEDLKRYDLAAQTLDDLASRFPGNTRDANWRAAELYEKRVKDFGKARAAYSRISSDSNHYKDAQKKIAQLSKSSN
jgi:serine/threonine protein kinase/tetratricopeptide (TPR) repeat protein